MTSQLTSYFLNLTHLTFDSIFLNWFFSVLAYTKKLFFKVKFLQPIFISSVSTQRIKLLLIFFFAISMAILPGYNIQPSTPAELASGNNFSNRFESIGVIVFIMLSLPLFAFMVADNTNSLSKLAKLHFFEVLILLFLIAIEVSTIFSINPQLSVFWLARLLRGLLIYLIFSRLVLQPKHFSYLIYAYIFIILYESFLSGAQLLSGRLVGIPFENFLRNERVLIDEVSYFRPIGTFFHPNVLSLVISLLLPLTLSASFSKIFKAKLLLNLANGLALFVPIIALSRWGILTVIFGYFLTFFLIAKLTKVNPIYLINSKRVQLVIITTIGFLILNPLIFNRFAFFSYDDPSLQTRLPLIKEAIYILKQNWLLGIGGGTFPFFLTNYDITFPPISSKTITSVHNLFFLIASEFGLIGISIFLLLCLDTARKFFGKVHQLTFERRLLTIGFFSSLAVFLFNSMWSLRSLGDYTLLYFWMTLGLLNNLLINDAA